MPIAPYYERLGVTVYCGDCLEVLPRLGAGSVNLCFVDPPYNIGVFAKIPLDEYLTWCERWIALCSDTLTANGAFWVSHKNPDVLVDISRIVAKYGRDKINWITWDKYNGTIDSKGFLDGYTVVDSLRSFQVMAEYLVYHADEGEWTTQCDKERGFIFEPLRAYLDSERKRAGIHKEDINEWLGFRRHGGMASRKYFSQSQWQLPTQKHYQAMRTLFNADNSGEYLRREYEDLRREYEDLRREYEDLRYTFNNPGLVSSVWQISPAPKNGHPTPKPMELLERIVTTTSNEGDLVIDPMMGSGTTGVACVKAGRRFIGIEIEERYCEIAVKRLAQMSLFEAVT